MPTRLITPAMLVLWLVLATVPLWIARVGLYPVSRHRDPDLVALRAGLQSGAGHRRPAVVRPRRLLRHRRLCVRPVPVQRRRQSLGLPRGGVRGRAASPARWWRSSSRTGAASTTRFMTIAFGQIFWFIADQVAQHHRRRGRPAQDRAAAGRSRRRHRSISTDNVAFYYFVLALFVAGRDRCCGGWCIRPSAASSQAIKQNETRAALRRLRRLALQGLDLHALGGAVRASPAACSPWRSSRPSPT